MYNNTFLRKDNDTTHGTQQGSICIIIDNEMVEIYMIQPIVSEPRSLLFGLKAMVAGTSLVKDGLQ